MSRRQLNMHFLVGVCQERLNVRFLVVVRKVSHFSETSQPGSNFSAILNCMIIAKALCMVQLKSHHHQQARMCVLGLPWL